MNGNTYFNFRFYNPLRVYRQQLAAANSEAQILRESIGVRAAYVSWIVRGFWPPYFVPGYKKVPFFYKIADMRRSSKKTPSSAKYVTKVRPPSVPECPPPGSPQTVRQGYSDLCGNWRASACMWAGWSNPIRLCWFPDTDVSNYLIKHLNISNWIRSLAETRGGGGTCACPQHPHVYYICIYHCFNAIHHTRKCLVYNPPTPIPTTLKFDYALRLPVYVCLRVDHWRECSDIYACEIYRQTLLVWRPPICG